MQCAAVFVSVHRFLPVRCDPNRVAQWDLLHKAPAREDWQLLAPTRHAAGGLVAGAGQAGWKAECWMAYALQWCALPSQAARGKISGISSPEMPGIFFRSTARFPPWASEIAIPSRSRAPQTQIEHLHGFPHRLPNVLSVQHRPSAGVPAPAQPSLPDATGTGCSPIRSGGAMPGSTAAGRG